MTLHMMHLLHITPFKMPSFSSIYPLTVSTAVHSCFAWLCWLKPWLWIWFLFRLPLHLCLKLCVTTAAEAVFYFPLSLCPAISLFSKAHAFLRNSQDLPFSSALNQNLYLYPSACTFLPLAGLQPLKSCFNLSLTSATTSWK